MTAVDVCLWRWLSSLRHCECCSIQLCTYLHVLNYCCHSHAPLNLPNSFQVQILFLDQKSKPLPSR